jgi:uncharacterized membrane protein SpoIIM required for sporulation
MFFFDRLYRDRGFRPAVVFIEAAAVSLAGIACGFVLFPGAAGLIGVFLVAMGQAGTVEKLLDRNRDEIWQRVCPSHVANLRLAVALLAMFSGILLSYVLAALVAPLSRIPEMFAPQVGNYAGHSMTDVEFGEMGAVLANNLVVLAVAFILSLLYRHGGMLLVLAWNASVWGVVFPYMARTAPDLAAGGPPLYLVKAMASILPHLVPEALAYVLVAMAGVFASRAIQKYDMGSAEFRRVMAAVARISALSVALLVAACAVEAYVAPALVGLLFG